ncbi:Fc.00g011550.m01.CDS01 [Cosmosporella sp. VM-42]
MGHFMTRHRLWTTAWPTFHVSEFKGEVPGPECRRKRHHPHPRSLSFSHIVHDSSLDFVQQPPTSNFNFSFEPQLRSRQIHKAELPRQNFARTSRQNNMAQPPPGGPPPEYYHPPVWTSRAPPPTHRPQSYLIPLASQFSLVIPVVIVILNIWWSATRRVCPPSATASSPCFWLLWLSLPVATVSFLWGVVGTISNRRAAHHMGHVSKGVDVGARAVLGLGTSVCFALLVVHMVRWDVWSTGCEAGMVALLGILMYGIHESGYCGSFANEYVDRIINWALFAWAALEMREQRRQRQWDSNHIGI